MPAVATRNFRRLTSLRSITLFRAPAQPARRSPPPSSGPLVELRGVVPEELLPGLGLEARPGQDVVDGVGELALRVRVVGAPHQHVVADHAADVVEHLLALVTLDRAEEATALHVL